MLPISREQDSLEKKEAGARKQSNAIDWMLLIGKSRRAYERAATAAATSPHQPIEDKSAFVLAAAGQTLP
jgi:hypothetical protein